jgi:hypothetical protein
MHLLYLVRRVLKAKGSRVEVQGSRLKQKVQGEVQERGPPSLGDWQKASVER